MDDPVIEDTFLLTFPMWFPIHPTAMSKGFIAVNGPSGEHGTPLFTDKDLLNRFIASVPPLRHYEGGAITGRQPLADLLNLIEAKGFTHVTIDHTQRGAMFFPIPQLREKLSRIREKIT